MIEAALSYVRRGWPVFPLAPNSKIPFEGTKGVSEATLDEDLVRQWWTRCPDANVAVAGADELAILDVDVKDKKRGDVTLVELVRERGPIGWTLQASTATRGYHFYFRIPPGHSVRPSVDRVGPGLDVRGKSSYVVAPPSRIGDRVYRWQDDGAEFARPSAWLLDAMVKASVEREAAAPKRSGRWGDDVVDRARRAIQYTDKLPASVAGAGGHDALWRAAVAIVIGFELPDSAAYELLVRFSNRCSPPWSEKELHHKIRQARNATQWQPGYLLRDQ